MGILQAILELACPPPGDLPDPGVEPVSLTSPALAGGFFTTGAISATLRKNEVILEHRYGTFSSIYCECKIKGKYSILPGL